MQVKTFWLNVRYPQQAIVRGGQPLLY